MRIRMPFSNVGSVLILASVIFALPPIARASGADPKADSAGDAAKNPAPAPRPRPYQPKKVYTNDDLGWFNPSVSAPSASRPAQAGSANPQASSISSGVQPVLLDPQQDPAWYAKQVSSLENDLAIVGSRKDALQQFRATSSGLPTGLVLNAPTQGITTDNLIAQLESRRQELEQQLDDLADLARVNGLPPGTVNQPSAPAEPSVPLAQQQYALTTEYRDVADRLSENQATLENMQQQAAAQGITLLPSTPGNGGNLTTNLVNDLHAQTDALQNALSDAEDNARTLGVQPGELR